MCVFIHQKYTIQKFFFQKKAEKPPPQKNQSPFCHPQLHPTLRNITTPLKLRMTRDWESIKVIVQNKIRFNILKILNQVQDDRGEKTKAKRSKP